MGRWLMGDRLDTRDGMVGMERLDAVVREVAVMVEEDRVACGCGVLSR